MLRIDSHQHFWNYDSEKFDWVTEEMSLIKKDFLPTDLAPVLQQNNFNGCVTIQVQQTEEENDFLLNTAEGHDFIKGVVGWTDLQSKNVEERLNRLKSFNKLKGFRHILQGEKKRDLMLSPDFKRGISLLSKYNFTYDVLIFPDQLMFAKELVNKFPEQKFVIDHLALIGSCMVLTGLCVWLRLLMNRCLILSGNIFLLFQKMSKTYFLVGMLLNFITLIKNLWT